MKVDTKRFIGASALIIGTVIGAGMFGIPFAITILGFYPGMILLAIVAAAIFITTLAYADLALYYKKRRQFAGIIKAYLGKPGFFVAFLVLLLGGYGSMLAYTVELGNLSVALFSPIFDFQPMTYALVFYGVGSLFVFFGLKSVTRVEIILVGFIISVIIFFVIVAIPHINPEYLTGFSLKEIFLPYGVMLFALPGLAAIPHVVWSVKRKRKAVRNVTIVGAVVPALLYVLFTFSVLGVTGPNTTESGIVGFGQMLGPGVLAIGAFLGLLAMGTSFITTGLVLTELFDFDAKLNRIQGLIFSLVPPLVLYLFGDATFIGVLLVVGAFFGGLNGILILIAWKKLQQTKARKSQLLLRVPEPIIWAIFLIFGLGVLYQLFLVIT